MYTKEDLINDIKQAGIKNDDILMIHSAFSSIKNIEGSALAVLDAFKEVLSDGLLLLPSHTWASMKEDNAIFDKKEANSCVGYLTNVAINTKTFLRSNHPTHSVLAFGKNALSYIRDDDFAKTPVSPNGSFGKLKNGGKILFLGAKLSKNTFIHSIEEEMNVADRFTDHIYTFYTRKEDNSLIKFKMPRHFSTLNPHISDNYEKLLPKMLEHGIASKVKILDSESYLVDAKKCYEYVKEILINDIHAFDDDREILI